MTWLSEIDPFIRRKYMYNRCVFCGAIVGSKHRPDCEFERMARVLREYAPIVKCADIYSCAGEETTFEECSKALILMAELLNNLSPDAKELVECSDG